MGEKFNVLLSDFTLITDELHTQKMLFIGMGVYSREAK